ncbi:MAG TPA: DUF3488 and transglutaminase-like domain-containing protein, partial [Bryobacteraceae bacterium]
VNLNFFVCLAFYLLFAIMALSSGEIRRSIERAPATARIGRKRFHPRLAVLSSTVAFGILALTAGLFFILPRTAEATFARFISHRIFLPGFSNNVTLGQIGEIKTSSRPVMHVRMWNRELPGALKWRGGALTDFDGKRWFNPDVSTDRLTVDDGHIDLIPPDRRRSGPHLQYDVSVDALETEALFFAGTPERLDLRSRWIFRTETGSYKLGTAPPPGFLYSVYSVVEPPPERMQRFYPPPALPLSARAQFLQLPRIDRRIGELAAWMTAGKLTDLDRARAIERRLRTEYGYTLDLPETETPDPLAYFLFTRKKGHCEYFASAMTVMLRTLGIPARLATGFQSGVYNPISDLWVVRASDAHTWVEAWIPGYGWATFDPTPPDPNPQRFALLTKLGLYLDAAETFWQEWVVSYDISRQGTLADRMEQGAHRLGLRWFDSLSVAGSDWQTPIVRWIRRFGLRAAIAIAIGVWLWILGPPIVRLIRMRQRVGRARRGEASVGDATLLYERMLHIMKRRGYQKPAWFTPAEFAASLGVGPLAGAVAEFTVAYNALRFGGRTEVAPRLSILLEELERQDRRP